MVETEEEETPGAAKKDVEKEKTKQTRNLSNDIQWNVEVSENSRWEELEQVVNVSATANQKEASTTTITFANLAFVT